MKLDCIIDTCSCIYLGQSAFRQRNLLLYLHERVNLYYSKEVSLEIEDHFDKGIPSFLLKKGKFIHLPKRYINDEYEKRVVGEVLLSRVSGGNKGEIDNFIISVDLAHHIKKNGVVFITDDDNALNGNLKGWIEAFPSIKIWNSFDVILYLYAEKIIPSKDFALDLIRDLFAHTAPKDIINGNDGNLKEATRKKFRERLTQYNDRVDRVSRVLF
jgi:hypothetical protein